jgi:hypothetical protein
LEIANDEIRNLRSTVKEQSQNYQIELESLKSTLRNQSGKNLELQQEIESMQRNFKMTNAELEKALADKEKLKINVLLVSMYIFLTSNSDFRFGTHATANTVQA